MLCARSTYHVEFRCHLKAIKFYWHHRWKQFQCTAQHFDIKFSEILCVSAKLWCDTLQCSTWIIKWSFHRSIKKGRQAPKRIYENRYDILSEIKTDEAQFHFIEVEEFTFISFDLLASIQKHPEIRSHFIYSRWHLLHAFCFSHIWWQFNILGIVEDARVEIESKLSHFFYAESFDHTDTIKS